MGLIVQYLFIAIIGNDLLLLLICLHWKDLMLVLHRLNITLLVRFFWIWWFPIWFMYDLLFKLTLPIFRVLHAFPVIVELLLQLGEWQWFLTTETWLSLFWSSSTRSILVPILIQTSYRFDTGRVLLEVINTWVEWVLEWPLQFRLRIVERTSWGQYTWSVSCIRVLGWFLEFIVVHTKGILLWCRLILLLSLDPL